MDLEKVKMNLYKRKFQPRKKVKSMDMTMTKKFVNAGD